MAEVRKELGESFSYDDEGFRMSTPVIIANYKAKRLKSRDIADLGAGIGVQALNFALFSDRVIAVERDAARIEYLRKNASNVGAGNLEIIHGDSLERETVKKIGKVETVHSDPSRSKIGERWRFEDLSPNPLSIVKAYNCDRFSFDLPATFPQEDIPRDWEVEYISLFGELKRLSTYGGSARIFHKSAVALPEEERVIEGGESHSKEELVRKVPLSLIYDLDGSLSRAGLVLDFIYKRDGLFLIHEDKQNVFLTSEVRMKSAFLRKCYRILDSARSMNEVKFLLKKHRAGKVVIRRSMDPRRYYDEKRRLEENLAGGKLLYLFEFSGIFYLAERMKDENESK